MQVESASEAQHDYEATLGIARKVLYNAAAMRLPLNPKVYRILYETEVGGFDTLKRIRDEMRTGERQVDVVEIEKLYDRVFDTNAENANLSDIGSRLSQEILDVSAMVSDRMGDNNVYLGTLNQARQSFGLFTRSSDVKKVLTDLLTESQQQAARTMEFLNQLEQKQHQILEMQAELEELRERVNRDHLTGISSRRHFDECLAAEFAEAVRSRGRFAVALADIDHFKKVNDTWGHGVGDSILQHFAAILKSNVKGKDVVARYGGEEFAVIFPNTSSRDARTVLEQIRQVFHGRNFVVSQSQERIGHISASFGVTELRPEDTTESLVTRADELLYEAKRRGRNNVVSDYMSGAPQRSSAVTAGEGAVTD